MFYAYFTFPEPMKNKHLIKLCWENEYFFAAVITFFMQFFVVVQWWLEHFRKKVIWIHSNDIAHFIV